MKYKFRLTGVGKGLVILLPALVFFLAACAGPTVKPTEQGVNVIKGLEISEGEEETQLTLEGNFPPTYTVFKLTDPLRVVIELTSTELGALDPAYEVNNGVINVVNTSQTGDQEGALGRIEIGLDRIVEYEVTTSENKLLVNISKLASPEEGEEAPPAEGALALEEIPPEEVLPGDVTLGEEEDFLEEAPGEEEIALPAEEIPPMEEAPVAEEAPIFEEAPPVEEAPIFEEAPPVEEAPIFEEVPPVEEAPIFEEAPPIEGVASKILDIVPQITESETKISFIANGPVGDYNAFRLEAELDKPPRLVVDVWDVGNLYPNNTLSVNSPLINQVRIGQYTDKVRFVLDSAQAEIPPYQITRENNQIIVTFAAALLPAVAEEIPPVITEIPPVVPVEKAPPSPMAAPELAPPPGAPVEVPPEALGLKRVYTGRKLSLEFRDGDIHDVLRIIAEVSNKNVIAGDDVKGKVTLRMINVPWDQALDIILQANALGKVSVGNIVRIAPAEKLRKEEEERLAALRAKEKLEDLVTKIVPVSYAKAKELETQIKPLLTERGSVLVDQRTNSLIIKDVIKNVRDAMELVKSLDLVTPQVVIEARIVEATSDFVRELGVQWGGRFAADAVHGNPTGLYFPNTIGATGGNTGGAGEPETPNFAVNLPAAEAGSAGGAVSFLFGSLNDTALLDLRLSAMERRGEGKLISSPRVATIDNREATIKQGMSVPYATVSQAGTQTAWIDATLSLIVTPHITANRSVIMKIKAEKNAPDFTRISAGMPSISKKEATTEVLVRDGETTVIGGIFTIEKSEARAGVPFFSKIPLIGWLFRYKKTVDSRTELLVFITPRVVS
ncbi:MAG: type IV pilus secretin PilQ [Deltaproteobacteria bacterium]|nr:MAG: type IV pilus secretin PilQ [Deltaproteobacteria bacterium]